MWRALTGKVAAPLRKRVTDATRSPGKCVPQLRTLHHIFVVLRPQAWSAESRETKCRRLAPYKRSNRHQVHNRQRTKSPSSASSRRSPRTRQVQRHHSPHQQNRHRHPHSRRNPLRDRLRLLHLFPVAMQLSPRAQYGKKRKILLWRGGIRRMVCCHAPLFLIQRLTVWCQRSQALLSAAPHARYASRE